MEGTNSKNLTCSIAPIHQSTSPTNPIVCREAKAPTKAARVRLHCMHMHDTSYNQEQRTLMIESMMTAIALWKANFQFCISSRELASSSYTPDAVLSTSTWRRSVGDAGPAAPAEDAVPSYSTGQQSRCPVQHEHEHNMLIMPRAHPISIKPNWQDTSVNTACGRQSQPAPPSSPPIHQRQQHTAFSTPPSQTHTEHAINTHPLSRGQR